MTLHRYRRAWLAINGRARANAAWMPRVKPAHDELMVLHKASSRAAAGTARLVHDLELHLLNLGEPLPLPRDQVIHLLVQVPDLELRLEIDAVVAFGPQAVLRLEALLAHHDDGRLDRGEARQDQVEQDVGIGIEALPHRHGLIEQDPHREAHPEDDDEGRAAAEAREAIGQPRSARAPMLDL